MLLQEQIGTRLRLPSENEEAQDPEGADAVYEAAVAVLKEHTRDISQYPMVHHENASYGFRRNTLGLRPLGTLASLIGLGAALVAAIAVPGAVAAFLVAAFVDLLLLLFWWRTVTEAWVRRAGEAYADALLRSLEHPAQGPPLSTGH
jgi:hypothetical protein